MTKTLRETTTAQQVAAALRNMFSPRELTIYSDALTGRVAFGFAWSVICEPHDHWNVRIGMRHDGTVTADVNHPCEGLTLRRDYDASHNMGQVIADVAQAVPVKE